MRYLIVNGDDFGMCHSANTAIQDLADCGGITSTTILTMAGWAAEAVHMIHQDPHLHPGVHLAHTSEWNGYRWHSLSGLPSLADAEGMAFVYAGQEAGCTHTPSLFDRDPVDWQGRSAQTEQLIAALNRTREAVLEPAAAAVLEENPQVLVFRLSSRDGMYTGVFDVLQHEETITVPLADGAYEDCITGNKISVWEGRVSASLCPLLLEEKKARK